MRKVLGYFLIIVGGSLILLYLIGISFAIFIPEVRNTHVALPYIIFSILIMLLLFGLMVRMGLKLTGHIKSSYRKIAEDENIEFERQVTITFQLDFKKYYSIIIHNSRMLFFIPFFLVVGMLLLFSGLSPGEVIIGSKEWSTWFTIIGVFLVLWPFLAAYMSRRAFLSNANLRHPITYTFANDKISISGENFDSSLKASSFYQMRETKTAIMLYQSRSSVNIILKSGFETEDDLNVVLKAFRNPA